MEQRSFGYWGRILRIDLSGGAWSSEELEPRLFRLYIGGRTLALYFLLRELPARADPLGPENILVLMTSPTTGYPISGQGRHTVAAKSPLTGGLLDSQCGGFWGTELKYAGWDGMIITGRAAKPVYILVQDAQVEILSAEHLWGKTTGDVDAELRAAHSQRARILQIGPAGENLVRYSVVTSDLHNYAARGGPGAVMGSKNLRAIVVLGTQRHLKAANPEGLRKLASGFVAGAKENPGLKRFHDLGTCGGVEPSSLGGNLPTFNHQDCSFAGAHDVSGEVLQEKLGAGTRSCFGCAVACKRVLDGGNGKYQVSRRYGGPEYESVASLGPQLGIGDIYAVAAANEHCNALGLDTISAGVTLAWAMECWERGLLTESDTSGLRLRWGDADTMLEALDAIAFRRGFGDLLAEGCKRASARIGRGTAQYAMHVKGQELPAHEPRGKWGAGLGFGVSPTGADHLQAMHDSYFTKPKYSKEAHWIEQEDISQLGLTDLVVLEDLSPAKVRFFVYLQYFWALHDVLDWCMFVTHPGFLEMRLEHLVEAVRCITGWRTNAFELLKAGERAVTLARVFNCREGFTPADDLLPDRLFAGLREGTLKGHFIDRGQYEEALRLYYQMMGWNEAGVPRKAKLEELGVGWAAELLG